MSLANKVTVFRILLIPLFLIALIYSRDKFVIDLGNKTYNSIPLLIFFIAMVSDVLDGFIARKHRQQSSLGTFLDPLADKLFLVSAFIMLAFLQRVPYWVSVIVIGRDLVIVLGWAMIFAIIKQSIIVPSVYGKFTTFFQTLTVLAVLLEVSYVRYIWHIAVIFTLISGFDYIIKGYKQINRTVGIK